MSGSNRRTAGAFGSLGLLVIAIFTWLIWDLSAQITDQRVRDEERTNAHIEYAEDRIDQECLSLNGIALRDCIHKNIEASRDHNRSEQDLDAQQQMALFTSIMGYTAIVGLFLGIGSVFLIFLTLRSTQQMVVDTRELGEAQVRAYLSIDAIDVTVGVFEGEITLYFAVHIKNSGQSPAREIAISLELGGADAAHGRLMIGDIPANFTICEELIRGHVHFSTPENIEERQNIQVAVDVVAYDVFGEEISTKRKFWENIEVGHLKKTKLRPQRAIRIIGTPEA